MQRTTPSIIKPAEMKCIINFRCVNVRQFAHLSHSLQPKYYLEVNVAMVGLHSNGLGGTRLMPSPGPAYLLYKAAVFFVCLSVCLSVCTPPPFFRHDRRTATKFGTHIRVDMGLILS